MGAQGTDVMLSEAAFKLAPLSIECKNKETNKSIIKDWEQTVSNAGKGEPVLVLSANNSPVLAIIEFDYLMHLLGALRTSNDTN